MLTAGLTCRLLLVKEALLSLASRGQLRTPQLLSGWRPG